MASATNGTMGIGTFFVEGLTLASAFSNPRRLDLIQVVNDLGAQRALRPIPRRYFCSSLSG